ncbi:flagellar filament capping protein FliD [Conexibacter woesei]|uniref:Flagellar hook-associated protein 2 n=1 Tax=Conexibacter woesei (strain DSM 14684 / CCUG 47730 / CIP 108061 / JCM 11494 / NBRC 100937 / ID131577) TaxID=469383 RepID=D3F3Y5_CONWI|nr:flagellar filament capping protein FliD [Conexibacter woesei]ADB48468.1 flagellar hook-associated 2 domain protein [Conexibacter woesei DSM 14684]
MAGINFSGIASGLNTGEIIEQMMAIEKRPRILLDNKQVLIETKQGLLRDFQTKLRALQLAATDLRSVSLWTQTQSVESSDATKVSASSTSGAGVGGYQIEVSQLANAAQRTYTFTRPAADGTITVDGHSTAIRAGMTAQEVATAINTDRDAKVYAAATDDGTLVLSSRATGDTGAGFIDVTSDGGAIAAKLDRGGARIERQGRDALYTLDGVSLRSSSNVIRDGLAGVTLTLRGVTTASGPVTISVGAPGANVEAIRRKLEAFVEAYNATIDLIRGKLEERTVPDPRSQQDIKNGVADPRTTAQKKAGTLFGDRQLAGMLSDLRQGIYSPVSGLPTGMDSLSSIGISTGAFSASTSRDTLAGRLTIDTDRLTKALTEDPTGVRNLLQGVNNTDGWARRFEGLLNDRTKSDGMLDNRIDGADDELRMLRRQMEQMDVRLALREKNLNAQFTALEVAISRARTQGDWLSGQLAGLNN